MTILREAVEKRKAFLIRRLLKFGLKKNSDGRQFYEISLSELEYLYISECCKKARKEQVEQIY